MYLKSLEMQGFKSFPDKTKLVFENETEVRLDGGDLSQGVTVIVGPNGSGKSNIADAMRWVLGEISSKSLRGSKMEDVIFGGADSRRPMGYAEVSVTFDNRGEFAKLDCPYDEVTVTRRYYRAGESEYFINRKKCRLKDIYELFMNTGTYSPKGTLCSLSYFVLRTPHWSKYSALLVAPGLVLPGRTSSKSSAPISMGTANSRQRFLT